MPPAVLWTPDRLAAGRARFAADPFDPDAGPGALATAAVLTAPGAGADGLAAQAAQAALAWNPRPEPGNLADDWRAGGLGPVLAYAWCAAAFAPADRAALKDRLVGWCDQCQAWAEGEGVDVETGNYFLGFAQNRLVLGAALAGEDPDTAGRLVQPTLDRLAAWLAAHPGGVPGEGTGYGHAGLAYLALPALLYPDAFRSPYLRAAVVYLCHSVSPTPMAANGTDERVFQCFPFADVEDTGCGAVDYFPGRARTYLTTFLTGMAGLFAGEPYGGYASWLLGLIAPMGVRADPWVRYAVDPPAPRPPADLPRAHDGGSHVFFRDSWGPDAVRGMVQLYRAAGHEHNAQGSYQLAAGADWVTQEQAGYSGDAPFTFGDAGEAWAHNTLVFPTGHDGDYPYGVGPIRAWQQGPPLVLALRDTPGWFYLAAQLEGQYQSSRGDIATVPAGWVGRSWAFLRDVRVLVVTDWFDVPGTTPTHLWQSRGPLARLEGNRWQVGGGKVLETLYPPNPAYEVLDCGAHGWPLFAGYQLRVASPNAAGGAMHHAVRLGDPAVPVALDVPRIHVGPHTLTWPGDSPWDITIDGVPVHRVETQRVSPSGVVWGRAPAAG